MEKLMVTRHSTLERLAHYANMASLVILLATGFTMYWGLPYISYSDAYGIHIITAAVFISINWILVPYNAFINGNLASYMFWAADFKRLWGVIKNFLWGAEYPTYTVYDIGRHRFVNRTHPVGKLLIFSHYLALFVITVTGILMYSDSLSILGVNISGIILRFMDALAPSFKVSGLALAIIFHVAMAYWFVAEAVIHVGMVQLDPRKSQHIRSMFIDGKENVLEDPTADIVDTSESTEEFEQKTVVKIK